MDVLDLIRQAQSAGLALKVEGDRLVVCGPRSAEALVAALCDRKHEVVAVLASAAPCDKSDQSDKRSVDTWRSPLAVRLAKLLATGLDEDRALGQALAEQAAQHARECGQDPWMLEPDGDGVSVPRCWRCGRTAPPEMQCAHVAAGKAGTP